MLSLKQFLVEREDKLTHLEHPEDHYFNAGPEGHAHAINTLVRTHNSIVKNKKQVTHSIKKDGSPSIVFGYHPENGKFFVGSKSVFNKTPKINHSYEDIEKNHGHAPGLVEKLKAGLDHLPKVTPKKGVFQGDVMFTKGDVKTDKTHHRFTPNTITYGVKKDSPLGEKVKKAKLGVYVHTHYSGNTFETLKPKFNKGNEGFGEHPDVMTDFGKSRAHYSPQQQKKFAKHIQKSVEFYRKIPDEHHDEIAKHSEHLKTYINNTVRTNTSPTVKGYRNWLIDRAGNQKSISRAGQLLNMAGHSNEISKSLRYVLDMHHHTSEAKHQLVDALSHDHDLEHHVAGEPTKPEGHVVSVGDRPSKLNRRREFNRLNFLKGPRQSK